MPKILVRSVYDAFEYVMDHYYPFGMEVFASHKDSYAVISIQDTHTDGFGFTFQKSKTCRDALTLYFDDIEKEVPGAVLFSEEQAAQIRSFLKKNSDVDTVLIHCFGGESRSRAVGAYANEFYGKDGSTLLKAGNANMYVYNLLKEVKV